MKHNFLSKACAFVLAGALTASSIEIYPLNAYAAEPVIDNIQSTVTSGMFAADSLDNTWLFGGGIETQGRFAEIGGVRNYIGQFEEYVRWVKRVNGVREGMQRYTINAGKAGQDAVQFSQKLSEFIAKFHPKAISYLIGPEDYSKGDNGIFDFEDAISEIIETSLNMNGNTGYIVIQLPHAVQDAQAAENAAFYADTARESVIAIARNRTADAGRIAIVDHLSQTDNANFKNTMLTDDGLLNANGHLLAAQQFAQEIYGATDNFPTISETWQADEAPETYLDSMPTATAFADGLKVTVPDGIAHTKWRYRLEIDGVTINGTAEGNPFTITQLPSGKNYLLAVCTNDGKTQLSSVEGTITEGNTSVSVTADNSLAQAIREKADNTKDSLTWLFMGDSITHGAAHTHGYDSIPQLFEKYLKEDLGRTDDIVINTAVSGATTDRTIENIEQRMVKYHPDIVSVMLGTNDTINAEYKTKLETIVTAIREVNPDALIIFRSPTPAKNNPYAAKLPGENGSVALMKSVAEKDGKILFIDQYTDWNEEIEAYPYLFGSQYYFGDGSLHPGAAGQLRMTTQFIRECGLNTDARIVNLRYQFASASETSGIQPKADLSGNNVAIRKQDLQDAYQNGEIGELSLTLTDSDGRTYTQSAGLNEDAAAISSLPVSRHYTVAVTANIKGNTPKIVTFALQEITLATGTEAEDLTAALKKHEASYKNDLNTYTEESAAAFKAAYDAANTAAAAGETDVEKLAGLRAALEEAAKKLTLKPAPINPPSPSQTDGPQTNNNNNQQPPTIIQGNRYVSGNYRYKVSSTSKLTVEAVGATTKNLKKLNIPDKIQLGGKTYTVTSIAASAFKNNKNAVSVTIGKNVAEIGKNAFLGCTKLKTASINSTKLKKIGNKAFYSCKSLNKITIKSKTLKTVGKQVFQGIGKKCVIKVPAAKLKNYKRLLSKKGQGKNVTIKK